TCSWTRCAGGFTPGRASASTCSTCPRRCGLHRNRSIRTTHRTTGPGSPASGRAEDLLELVRSRDLQLIVAAVLRLLVLTPPHKGRRMPEAVALHVVVLPFAHAIDPQRLPREVLPRAPPALSAGHPRRAAPLGIGPVGPLAPRMPVERVRAQ